MPNNPIVPLVFEGETNEEVTWYRSSSSLSTCCHLDSKRTRSRWGVHRHLSYTNVLRRTRRNFGYTDSAYGYVVCPTADTATGTNRNCSATERTRDTQHGTRRSSNSLPYRGTRLWSRITNANSNVWSGTATTRLGRRNRKQPSANVNSTAGSDCNSNCGTGGNAQLYGPHTDTRNNPGNSMEWESGKSFAGSTRSESCLAFRGRFVEMVYPRLRRNVFLRRSRANRLRGLLDPARANIFSERRKQCL